MKKIYVLTLLSFFLLACNNDSIDNISSSESLNLNSSSDESIQSDESIESIDPTIMQPIIEDGICNYNIVVENPSEVALSYVNEFVNSFNSQYGYTMTINESSEVEEYNEIIVGNVTNRSESAFILNQLTPSAYCVREADGKIVVTGYDDLAILKGLNHLLENIQQYDNNYGIRINYEYYGDCYMNTFVPKLEKSSGIYEKTYYAGDGYYQLCYNTSKYQDMHNYSVLLEEHGFEFVSENEIGLNYFFTYKKDDAVVNLAYYSESKRFHVVYGKSNYLPSLTADNTNKIVASSITHIQRNGSKQSSPGLSIVCQLIDGSYIIIDGGPTDSTDEANLLKFLQDNNPIENSLPKVRWFFTHAHHDHMGLAVSFLNKYYDKIDMELFAYNFPDFDTLPIPSEPANRIQDSKDLIAEFDQIYNKHYSDVDIFKFHAGDKLVLPGCQIDVFLTHETFYPQEFSWINHTSSAFKVTMNETSMLVLGDCEQTVCEYLAALYKESIKCDILQVTHHGLNGGSIALYGYVKPTICFWAIDGERFTNSDMCLGTKWGFEYNAWLRNEQNGVKEHYHASETTKIICEEDE